MLIHQLPAKPAYLRVKVWRRLQALGAVAVKNAVYALPANEQTQEDFEWVLKEITEGGGEAMICEAQLIDGVSDQEVQSLVTATRALKDRTWVTRQGVHVDRIACAWLIRRFIDPGARFRLVSGKGYAPGFGELRFDMFEAEFTHEGDRCSFEVLLGHAGRPSAPRDRRNRPRHRPEGGQVRTGRNHQGSDRRRRDGAPERRGTPNTRAISSIRGTLGFQPRLASRIKNRWPAVTSRAATAVV
jgi:hypothetical protein